MHTYFCLFGLSGCGTGNGEAYLKRSTMALKQVKVIKLPKFLDKRGNLSFIEEENHIPFKIQRTYWIYDVPGGEARGGHAYKENEEFIVALSGSFDVILDDGKEKKNIFLEPIILRIVCTQRPLETNGKFLHKFSCINTSLYPL